MTRGESDSFAGRGTNGRHQPVDSFTRMNQQAEDVEQTEEETHWTNALDSEFSFRLGRGIDQTETTRPSRAVSIFRIPPDLKRLHERSFDPDLMVLGLFSEVDFNSRSRNAMNYKLGIVCAFIDALNGPEAFGQALSSEEGSSMTEDGGSPWDWEKLQAVIVEDPSESQYYYDLNESGLKSSQFVRRVLTMDAVFLCIYLCTYLSRNDRYGTFNNKKWTENPFFDPFPDVVFAKESSFHNRIVDDITKLENQIPLNVVARVLKVIHSTRHPSLGQKESLQKAIREELRTICQNWILLHEKSLPGICSGNWDDEPYRFDFNEIEDCDHLLACLCRATGSSGSGYRSRHGMLEAKIGIRDLLHSSARHQVPDSSCLPSACRLSECGIHFQRKGRATGLVPIFERGFMNLSATLHIPSFCVMPNTETIWRNMVAFLRESTGNSTAVRQESMEFIFFMRFIDELVETEYDVSLLRTGSRAVISKNLLGTNQQVADLINTVVRHGIPDIKRYDESEEWIMVRHNINKFLKERRRIALLEWLRHNFGKPWLIASVIVGLTVLVLSFLQSLYTMLAYYKQ